jgi:hypothetical protein
LPFGLSQSASLADQALTMRMTVHLRWACHPA